MNVFTKVLVVLVLLLSAAFAGSQMMLHSKRAEYHQLYAKADGDLRLERQRAADLEGERNDLARERDDINRLLADERAYREEDKQRLGDEVSRLQGELARAQDDLRKANAEKSALDTRLLAQLERITTLDRENFDFKDALRTADGTIKGLQDDVRARDGSIRTLNASIAQLNEEMREVAAERNYLANAVAQAKMRGFDVLAEDVPIIDAKVLDVDPTISAVVLNKGSNDDVKMNFPFTISRDLEYVAKVTIVEVYPELCVGRVVPGFEEMAIEVGDDASTRR
jgi:hypothetical protein